MWYFIESLILNGMTMHDLTDNDYKCIWTQLDC